MAVIAVGDFTAEDIEKRILAEFSDLKNPTTPRPRDVVSVPAHKAPIIK